MPKITNILAVQDMPLRLLAQLDDQLNDRICQFDGDIYDLAYYLTDQRFTIVQVNDDEDFFVEDNEFFVLDCEELQLEDCDLTDPKNLLDDADSFTIAEYKELFYGNVLISSIREKIVELSEIPYDLQVFSDIDFK